MAIWWLELSAFTTRPGSILVWGTKIPQATWPVQRKEKKKPSQARPSMTIFYFSTCFLNTFPCIHMHAHTHIGQLSSNTCILLYTSQYCTIIILIIISYSRTVTFYEYCSIVITNRMIFSCVLSIKLF